MTESLMGIDGNDLVFLHGAFSGGWSFDRFRRPFEDAGYTVHAPDLRHHKFDGDPATPPEELAGVSMLDYMSDLNQVIDSFAVPPIIIGFSMGGLLAQMLAAQGQASATILLAPSAPWGVLPGNFEHAAAANWLFLEGNYWDKVIVPTEVAVSHMSFNGEDLDATGIPFSHFVPESGLALFEILHWTLDIRQTTKVYPRDVQCPVFCVAGGNDRVNPPEQVRRIAKRYGDRADYAEIDDHGHWLIDGPRWRETAAACLGWLSLQGLDP